jgi:hypothetical protein
MIMINRIRKRELNRAFRGGDGIDLSKRISEGISGDGGTESVSSAGSGISYESEEGLSCEGFLHFATDSTFGFTGIRLSLNSDSSTPHSPQNFFSLENSLLHLGHVFKIFYSVLLLISS